MEKTSMNLLESTVIGSYDVRLETKSGRVFPLIYGTKYDMT